MAHTLRPITLTLDDIGDLPPLRLILLFGFLPLQKGIAELSGLEVLLFISLVHLLNKVVQFLACGSQAQLGH